MSNDMLPEGHNAQVELNEIKSTADVLLEALKWALPQNKLSISLADDIRESYIAHHTKKMISAEESDGQ